MPTLSREDAKKHVRDAGLRATAPRIAVLRLLAEAGKPLSHSDVVSVIGTRDWDQATLYRNLLKLAEAKLARVASRINGVARYEFGGADESAHLHPHFSCRLCGEVACLPQCTLTGSVSGEWKRALATSELQVVGECPACLAKQGD